MLWVKELEEDKDDREQDIGSTGISRPGIKEMKGRIGEATQQDGRHRGAGQAHIAGQENAVDKDHNRQGGAKHLERKGQRDTQ